MPSDYLVAAVSVLILVSGAAERLVEVIKGFIPRLNVALTEPVAESRRKAYIQILTIGCCLLTVFLAKAQIAEALWGTADPDWTQKWPLLTGIGVLAAGGSSLWNSVLSYLVSAKDLKKSEAIQQKEVVATTIHATGLGLPATMPATGSYTQS